METLDLFAHTAEGAETFPQSEVLNFPTEEPEARALRRITQVMRSGQSAVVATSLGKDSSCLANLVLSAARALQQKGEPYAPIFVTHSQTGVENPEVSKLAYGEIEKIKAYAALHSLDVTVLLAEPALSDTFPVAIIGGRRLPSYASTNGECSQSWKVEPQRRLIIEAKKAAVRSGKAWAGSVVMTGVRSDESDARSAKVLRRGETAEGLWTNEAGDLRASPILCWTTDDVWTYLAHCNAGIIDSYSDFADTMELYRQAGAESCVIVADMKTSSSRTSCGARTGCWSCLRVQRDRSMEHMIASEPRNAYLTPLSRLRSYLQNSQYDWSRRQFVGRSISSDGFIEIGADTFSPKELRDLFVYTLTAERLSGVQIMSLKQIIAIDARWSMYGLWPPFYALKLLNEVQEGGWKQAPKIDPIPKTDVPKIGKIHVGSSWYEATGLNSVAGLRDIGMELFHESCGASLKALPNGALVANYEEGDRFDVDAEGAADFIGCLADDYIERYCHTDYGDWTEGYKSYLRLGIITVAKGQSRSTDEIMRRTQWRQQHGLHGQQNLQDLIARCTVLYQRQQQLI